MARPRKTDKEKYLTGNPGKRKQSTEIEIDSPSMVPPEILSEAAKEYWRQYAPLLHKIGLFTALNVPTFIEYCRIRALLDQVHGLVGSELSTLQETKWSDFEGKEHTKVTESQYFKQMRQLSADSLKYERALKMTPDRMAGTYKPVEPPSKADLFLRRLDNGRTGRRQYPAKN